MHSTILEIRLALKKIKSHVNVKFSQILDVTSALSIAMKIVVHQGATQDLVHAYNDLT